jgi:hypothetical protein
MNGNQRFHKLKTINVNQPLQGLKTMNVHHGSHTQFSSFPYSPDMSKKKISCRNRPIRATQKAKSISPAKAVETASTISACSSESSYAESEVDEREANQGSTEVFDEEIDDDDEDDEDDDDEMSFGTFSYSSINSTLPSNQIKYLERAGITVGPTMKVGAYKLLSSCFNYVLNFGEEVVEPVCFENCIEALSSPESGSKLLLDAFCAASKAMECRIFILDVDKLSKTGKICGLTVIDSRGYLYREWRNEYVEELFNHTSPWFLLAGTDCDYENISKRTVEESISFMILRRKAWGETNFAEGTLQKLLVLFGFFEPAGTLHYNKTIVERSFDPRNRPQNDNAPLLIAASLFSIDDTNLKEAQDIYHGLVDVGCYKIEYSTSCQSFVVQMVCKRKSKHGAKSALTRRVGCEAYTLPSLALKIWNKYGVEWKSQLVLDSQFCPIETILDLGVVTAKKVLSRMDGVDLQHVGDYFVCYDTAEKPIAANSDRKVLSILVAVMLGPKCSTKLMRNLPDSVSSRMLLILRFKWSRTSQQFATDMLDVLKMKTRFIGTSKNHVCKRVWNEYHEDWENYVPIPDKPIKFENPFALPIPDEEKTSMMRLLEVSPHSRSRQLLTVRSEGAQQCSARTKEELYNIVYGKLGTNWWKVLATRQVQFENE